MRRRRNSRFVVSLHFQSLAGRFFAVGVMILLFLGLLFLVWLLLFVPGLYRLLYLRLSGIKSTPCSRLPSFGYAIVGLAPTGCGAFCSVNGWSWQHAVGQSPRTDISRYCWHVEHAG